jgi:N-acetylmuramoyl-L-alanine amidase
MTLRLFVAFVCLFLLTGCLYKEEPPLVLRQTVPPPQPKITPVTPPVVSPYPAEWFPPKGIERKWTAIIIHHSATAEGNAAIFDEWHRKERNWNGVGYDFVIGNGSNSGNGLVEVTYRWRQQTTGAHCGGTPGNWANEEGVGICLVGDFNKTSPSEKQLQSLAKLIGFLQKRYGIPDSRVFGHGNTPGGHATDCPGRYFSMYRLKAML